jgi:hypothetical protein
VPLFGSLDTAPLVRDAPLASGLATEPVTLERAEVMQLMFEIESSPMLDVLPPALCPTDPPIAGYVWISSTGGPFGDFTLAQVRVGCRAGVRPRGYVVGTVIDNMDAANMLAERWGFGCIRGDVSLSRGYHEIRGSVAIEGYTLLDAALIDPIPLSGAEIQFAASMQLARVERDGSAVPRLIQVDPDFTFHRAARGHAQIGELDAGGLGDGRVRPVYPVSAWYALCDLTLPRVRYVCDPDVPALQGTESL